VGTWGTAIFSDDFASDVRNEFKDHIGDGLTPEQATAALVDSYSDFLEDPDSGPPFWLGLALSQWTLGRLLPAVRDRALHIIDSGEDLRRWEDDPSLSAKRQKVLALLREKLVSPLPPAKKVPQRFRASNDWPVGAIIAYRLSSGQRWLLRVIGHHQDMGGKAPVVEFLDWEGEDLPSKWTMRWLKVRTGTQDQKQFMIGAVSKRDFPTDRVSITGVVLKARRRPGGFFVLLWRNLDKDLGRIFGGDANQS